MPQSELYPLLERAARQWPDEIGITSGMGDFTYQQLESAAKELATTLSAAGVGRADKVGILCPNGPAYLIASFALFLIDGIVVPVFPGLKQEEIAGLMTELQLDALCLDPQFADQLPASVPAPISETTLFDGKVSFSIVQSVNHSQHEHGLRKLGDLGAPMLRFTSGTTSSAKGVIIPQSAMMEYTRRFTASYSIQRGDCLLNLLSMAHIFYQVTAGLWVGAKIVVQEVTDLESVARSLESNRITHIEAAPSFYAMLINTERLTKEHFRGVKYLTSCGAALADHVAAAFREKYQREIVQRYGLTETGPVLINLSEDVAKRGTLGTAAPGCEIRLAPNDPDSPGSNHDAEGEILVRSPGLFAGYYLPWTPAETVLDNGWFRTGDIATRDQEGYFRIVGRSKNIINVGGVKVFPDEIEAILRLHPAVEEALVFGAPDARFGESPRAKVRLRPGATCERNVILQFANDKLSFFKALRDIEFVDALPKTVTGKLKRSGV